MNSHIDWSDANEQFFPHSEPVAVLGPETEEGLAEDRDTVIPLSEPMASFEAKASETDRAS
jgi:hypothetical protein